MTAKEFLKSKNIWVEQFVADENAPENYIRLEDLLKEYANQQLLLNGVSNRRKLLIAYEKWCCSLAFDTMPMSTEQIVDKYLKSN